MNIDKDQHLCGKIKYNIALCARLCLIGILIIGLIAASGCIKTEKEELIAQKFSEFKTQYQEKTEQGYDTTKAEEFARKAKEAFDGNDYEKAEEFLDMAFEELKKAKIITIMPIPTQTVLPGAEGIEPYELKNVKVSIVYERLNDARPKRSVEEHNKILKETNTDLIFRAWWRWNPLPNNCSEFEPEEQGLCEKSGYSYEQLENSIQEIKKENPNIIIIGAIPAQRIVKTELNEMTGEIIGTDRSWDMVVNPEKWGIVMSKEEFQQKSDYFSGGGYFPDITNPEYQELLLSWAKKQIDAGVDGIWIDLLYTQADLLKKDTGDVNHIAVKESYDAASRIVDAIHNYGDSKGRYIYVGTWSTPMHYPYTLPKLDFVTETPTHKEIYYGEFNEKGWDNKKAKIEKNFGNIPIFVFIDWAGDSGQMAIFSQELSKEEQSELLKIADEFFERRGMKFVYPVHGGSMGSKATVLAYGKYEWYDSLAPEFQTYDTIKQLAQNKSTG